MNPRPVEAQAIDNRTLLIKLSNGEVKKGGYISVSSISHV